MYTCFVLLSALGVFGVIVSDDLQRYLSCTALADNATRPVIMWSGTGNFDPFFLYGIGKTISDVLVYELIIAQSPDKMKGFVFGEYQ